MECPGVLERMSVPRAVAVAVPVGEPERGVGRVAADVPVMAAAIPVPVGERSVVVVVVVGRRMVVHVRAVMAGRMRLR